MSRIKFLLVALVSMAFASCDTQHPTKKEILAILKNEPTIAVAYHDFVTIDTEKGYWIRGAKLYNRGNSWFEIESEEDLGKAHKIEMHTPKTIPTNAILKDQNNKQVYMPGVKNGQFVNCRGCCFCYEHYRDAGLIEYRIIEDDGKEDGNLRIATSLTEEGAKYQIKPLNPEYLVNPENRVIVKVAEFAYKKVNKISRTDSIVTAEVEYYIDYTPFGEAVGYKTNKNETTTESFRFDKVDGEWRVNKFY